MTVVRAAGGVVWRPDPDGGAQPRIVLVHRPKHDDWSLPKGKLGPGEHPLVAAVREVREETAVRAVPQTRLPSVCYQVVGRDGAEVDKTVEYWSMRAVAYRDRPPDREVDDVRWVTPAEAARLLTYRHDRQVVRAFVGQPPVTGLVALVRHASASERGTWPGPDAERPLDGVGVNEADMLATVLAVLGVGRVLTATPDRCVQTLAPLAERIGATVETDARFDEGSDVAAAAAALRLLARAATPSMVCSQGSLIPPVLGMLAGRPAAQFRTRKGHGWLLAFAGHRLIAAAPIDPGRVAP